MKKLLMATLGVVLTALAVVPAQAQTAAVEPTKKDPVRFEAVAMNLQGGRAGRLDIVIERWTTDPERAVLVDMLMGTKDLRRDQDKLRDKLQDIEPRTGYIRSPQSIGWDLKYARQNKLPDGSTQIVVVTDKPVSFFAARNQTRTTDYPFTLIEMRFPAGSTKGEGKLLTQTNISVKDGRLELEIYGQEPTRLTTIERKDPKPKK
ncbi:hypothetical protein TBR22_A16940 [Luteitalea sp. TBR-22]|uniref:hypothetical protein n=1 Tax=Luteitalea sp. TBR-22 TaxID=2802971 RepID=UPI001AF27DDC|nr:hypothetical protein [Luteitalea sp. TBR-22]BCS32479.1 hypothetical protein TBR22_A16940 [Luteitalea sp. TBR-22]